MKSRLMFQRNSLSLLEEIYCFNAYTNSLTPIVRLVIGFGVIGVLCVSDNNACPLFWLVSVFTRMYYLELADLGLFRCEAPFYHRVSVQ